MGKKLSLAGALLVFVVMAFLAGVLVGGRRAADPTTLSSRSEKPREGIGAVQDSRIPTPASGQESSRLEHAAASGRGDELLSLPGREEDRSPRSKTVLKSEAPATAQDLVPLPAAGGVAFKVSGTVKLAGPVPAVKPNRAMGADPSCSALHPEPPPKEDLVVDPAGGVRWVFVYLKKGLEGRRFDPPAGAAMIDQVGCTYTPHVLGVMVGQTLNFRNSDPLLHNVHGIPFLNKEFNFGQTKGAVNGVRFVREEVPVKIQCNIHPFMTAWVGVVEHPFFAVTDAQGRYEIHDLPAGTYTIAGWHEKLTMADQEIVVQGAQTVNFTAVLK